MKQAEAPAVRNLVAQQLRDPGWRGDTTRDADFLEALGGFCEGSSFDAALPKAREDYGDTRLLEIADSVAVRLVQAQRRVLDASLGPSSGTNPDVFVVAGCGKTDGFALLAGGAPAVFVDVTTILTRGVEAYEDGVFFTHELLHGIHFVDQPNYAASRREGPQEALFKALLAEGIATYYSGVVTKETDSRLLWLGMFDAERFDRWRARAQAARPEYAERIHRFLCDPSTEPGLTADLMYVLDMSELDRKRFGYWYGFEIAAKLHESHGDALRIEYDVALSAALEYFDVPTTCD